MNKEIMFALLAALSFGIAPIFEKLGLARTEPAVALLIRAFTTSVFIMIYIFYAGKSHELLVTDFKSIVYVLLGGIFGVLFAQFFYFKALQYGEIGRVMPIVGSFPVIAFLLSVLIFGETFTIIKFIGLVLVVTGVILLGE